MTTIFDETLIGFRAVLAGTNDAAAMDAAARIDWAMHGRPLAPHPLACLHHLDRAADAAPGAGGRLARLLCANRDQFHWGQTYTEMDFGRAFTDNYGWLEVFGTRGHFTNDEVAGGVLVLGPNLVYPDHHHVAEEIYIPLTGGTEWRMGDDAFRVRDAGEVVHHASNVSHAMRTGADPLLALYLWRGGPLAQKSTVTGAIPAQGEV